MRIPTPQALSAVVALPLIVGCSGSLAIPPHLVPTDSVARSAMWRAPRVSALMAAVSVNSLGGPRQTSFNKCPATGPIKYVADSAFSVIHIYSGKFRYGAQCGLITAGSGGSGLHIPYGLYVKTSTHDLYVANTGHNDIIVFHRGHKFPYDTYTDPTVQYPVDVTVGTDGTLLASNQSGSNFERGSISTWIQGPNGWNFCRKFSDAGLS